MIKLNASSVYARCKMGLSICMFALGGYWHPAQASDATQVVETTVPVTSANRKESVMLMQVGDRRFEISLENNAATRALMKLTPLTLDMDDLNGNEKKFDLAQSLPMDEKRPGAIEIGDFMLYGKDTLVIFYAAFKTPYSYTRLGRVDNPQGLAQALGSKGVNVVLSNKVAD